METSNFNDTLRITAGMEHNWRITAKWAMFFAVLGFIVAGLYTLGAVAFIPLIRTLSAMGTIPEPLATLFGSFSWLFVLLYLGVVAIMFFLAFFHMKFANLITRALNFTDQASFNNAWRNMRNYFRLNGIVTIVSLALYFIGIIVVASVAGSVINEVGELN